MIVLADLGDVLGSPVWTVLATLLAVAAIWVTIWLYRRQQSHKSLSYSIKLTKLVSVHDAAKGRIRIFFEDEQISQAHLLEARIENVGNVPVPASDFEQDILFELGQEASPLTHEVTRTAPSDLEVPVYSTQSAIRVSPLLLNPGDGFTVKALVRDLTPKEVKCHYRIIGVSEMVDATAQRKSQRAVIARILDNTVGVALISTLAAIAFITLGTSVSNLFDSGGGGGGPPPALQMTLVTLTDGNEVCGEILQFDRRKLLIVVARTRLVESVPRKEVQGFQRGNCS